MKCLVNIKQGFDHPVSVTTTITRSLAPFAGVVITCNVHTFILYYNMYFNSVIQ